MGDPTADAGIDIGQRWKDCIVGDYFTVNRTYRDNPINPTFLVEYEPVWATGQSRGFRTVTLAYIQKYCERA